MAEINPLVNALQGANRPVYQQPGLGNAQRQQQIANLLLQSGQRTNNPLVAALTGFFGTTAGMEAAQQFGDIEQAQMKAEQERLARQEGREERKLDMEESQFEKTMALEYAKLKNKNKGEQILPVTDSRTGMTMLYQGGKPMTDGLEKGMQWAIDEQGQRMAVQIPTMSTKEQKRAKDDMRNLLEGLLNNPDGVMDSYGIWDSNTFAVQDETRAARVALDTLRSQETLKVLPLMKGVLSDKDIEILQKAAAGEISENATEQQAIGALMRMYSRLGGDASKTALGRMYGGGGEGDTMNNTGFRVIRVRDK